MVPLRMIIIDDFGNCSIGKTIFKLVSFGFEFTKKRNGLAI